MIVELDTDSSVDYYDQLTQLDGVEYLLRFLWSERSGCWRLNIYDQDENPLALNVKLVVSGPKPKDKPAPSLLRRFKDPRLPQGRLYIADMSGQFEDVKEKTELGTRCLLVYVTADEFVT